MIRSATILVFHVLTTCVFGQNSYSIQPDLSYQKKWTYFELEDTITGTVLFHWPIDQGECDGIACCPSGIIIIQLANGDTIRVLDQCDDCYMFFSGRTVSISPEKEPKYGAVTPLPPPGYQPSDFDLNVLKTTWGDMTFPKVNYKVASQVGEIYFTDENGQPIVTPYEICDLGGSVIRKGTGNTAPIQNLLYKQYYILKYNDKTVKFRKKPSR